MTGSTPLATVMPTTPLPRLGMSSSRSPPRALRASGRLTRNAVCTVFSTSRGPAGELRCDGSAVACAPTAPGPSTCPERRGATGPPSAAAARSRLPRTSPPLPDCWPRLGSAPHNSPSSSSAKPTPTAERQGSAQPREAGSGPADYEGLIVAGAGHVVPACRAVARRGTRHGRDLCRSAGVQRRRAGHLDRGAPRAVYIADDERLLVTGAVPVRPAGRAVAGLTTGHRFDVGVSADVQGRQTGHLDCVAPRAVLISDHERLVGTLDAGSVASSGRAVVHRSARHRSGAVSRAGRRSSNRYYVAPGPVLLAGHEWPRGRIVGDAAGESCGRAVAC